MYTVTLGLDLPTLDDDTMQPTLAATSERIKCPSLDAALTVAAAHKTAVDVYRITVWDSHGSNVHTWRR